MLPHHAASIGSRTNANGAAKTDCPTREAPFVFPELEVASLVGEEVAVRLFETSRVEEQGAVSVKSALVS